MTEENTILISEAARHFGRMGQSALQSKFKTPEEKSKYFRELQKRSARSRLNRNKKAE